jgi:hypothetical protein
MQSRAASSNGDDVLASDRDHRGSFGWESVREHRRRNGIRHIGAAKSAALRRLASLSPPVVYLWIPAVTVAAFLTAPASAHVKWFAPYNVTRLVATSSIAPATPGGRDDL